MFIDDRVVNSKSHDTGIEKLAVTQADGKLRQIYPKHWTTGSKKSQTGEKT